MHPILSTRRTLAKVFARAFTAIGGSFLGTWSGGRDGFHRAFQQGVAINEQDKLLSFSAVFACVVGIASDLAKMRIKLCRNESGIWTEITENQPWLPVLRKPNHFQNRIQFSENYFISKLTAGNTYVLKGRDGRGVVNALYVLDPKRTFPLLAENGDVYYQLSRDPLSRKLDGDIVPAREIIHDRGNCLYHPLVGIPPIMACAMSATMGNKIQENSAYFFQNKALPGGVITAPGKISPDQVERIEKRYQEQFSGKGIGNVWVLGNDMKFDPITMTAEAAQLAEQLKWTVSDVARAFHYPEFKLGGPLPPYAGNVDALITSYYTDCLQILVESAELCYDEGLELPSGIGTEFDLDNLMRMDTASLYKSNSDAVGGGWMGPNEARFRANYKPVEGGESPMLQQQNYSLSALAKRDALQDPFNPKKEPEPITADLEEKEDLDVEDYQAIYYGDRRKELPIC